MRLAPVFALLLAFGCATSPTPLPGPRPLGNDATLSKGEATLKLRYRYEVTADRAIELLIDLSGEGTGSVGTVELALTAEGLKIEGSPTWSGPIEAGTASTHRVVLRPTGSYGQVTITHAVPGVSGPEPVMFRFLFNEDEVRPCQLSEEACKPGA